MGIQLIICMETNKKCKSDFIYISRTINQFYSVDNSRVRIQPVFMNGKGRYASTGVIREINSFKNQYKAASINNISVVIYCFDCDDYDTKPEDMRFIEQAKRYCSDNGYRFVWFCKDIEQVFIGRKIPDNQKKQAATQFAAKKMIENVDKQSLKAETFQNHRSNLCKVLDEYLL